MKANENLTVIDANTLNLAHAAHGGQFGAATTVASPSLYAGLFEAGNGEYALWSMTDWDSFTNKWTELSKADLRLVGLDTSTQSGITSYNGVYMQSTEDYGLWCTTDWSSFKTYYQDNSNLRLIDMDFSLVDGVLWYAGVWLGAPSGQHLVANTTWEDFSRQWKELSTQQGMRLTCIQAYPVGNELLYTGVFELGSGGYALYNTLDWNDFIQHYQTYDATMELVDFQVADFYGTQYFIGVWRETQIGHQFIYSLDWGSFISKWRELAATGYRLRHIEQQQVLAPTATPLWAQSFQAQLGATVQGYAFATMQYGKNELTGSLNLARSSDETQNPSQAWTPDTRLHLASVSKPITAVALLHLLEQSALQKQGITLDSPFYAIIKDKLPSVKPASNSVMPTITLKNLLTMKSGMVGDGTLEGDLWPFLTDYLNRADLVVGTPGETYLYSNTNFTILQAVMEQLLKWPRR